MIEENTHTLPEQTNKEQYETYIENKSKIQSLHFTYEILRKSIKITHKFLQVVHFDDDDDGDGSGDDIE